MCRKSNGFLMETSRTFDLCVWSKNFAKFQSHAADKRSKFKIEKKKIILNCSDFSFTFWSLWLGILLYIKYLNATGPEGHAEQTVIKMMSHSRSF